MGPGIAATLARAGATVRLYDISAEAIARAEAAYGIVRRRARGRSSRRRRPRRHPSLRHRPGRGPRPAPSSIIEAVPEKLDLKREVLADLEARVGRRRHHRHEHLGHPDHDDGRET